MQLIGSVSVMPRQGRLDAPGISRHWKKKLRNNSIIEFWIPQFEGILNQLDPLTHWGKGHGNDVETGLYIVKMFLLEVCQCNLR